MTLFRRKHYAPGEKVPRTGIISATFSSAVCSGDVFPKLPRNAQQWVYIPVVWRSVFSVILSVGSFAVSAIATTLLTNLWAPTLLGGDPHPIAWMTSANIDGCHMLTVNVLSIENLTSYSYEVATPHDIRAYALNTAISIDQGTALDLHASLPKVQGNGRCEFVQTDPIDQQHVGRVSSHGVEVSEQNPITPSFSILGLIVKDPSKLHALWTKGTYTYTVPGTSIAVTRKLRFLQSTYAAMRALKADR